MRSTLSASNSSGPISFCPPVPRVAVSSVVRTPCPRVSIASSALFSSSGWPVGLQEDADVAELVGGRGRGRPRRPGRRGPAAAPSSSGRAHESERTTTRGRTRSSFIVVSPASGRRVGRRSVDWTSIAARAARRVADLSGSPSIAITVTSSSPARAAAERRDVRDAGIDDDLRALRRPRCATSLLQPILAVLLVGARCAPR